MTPAARGDLRGSSHRQLYQKYLSNQRLNTCISKRENIESVTKPRNRNGGERNGHELEVSLYRNFPLARSAKLPILEICITNRVGEMHYTSSIRAVFKAEYMADLMHRFLQRSMLE